MLKKWTTLWMALGLCLSVVVNEATAEDAKRGEKGKRAVAQGDKDPAQRGRVRTGGGTLFAAIDTDSDGAITQEEMRNALAAFAKLDADNDGKVTVAEVAGGRGQAGGKRGAQGNSGQRGAKGGRNATGGAKAGNKQQADGRKPGGRKGR